MSVPGFGDLRDEPDAPFYLSREREFATPEKTAAEILRRFSGVVFNVVEAADRAPITLELEDVIGWHRAVFISTFPHQAGQLRSGPTYFGVQWIEDGKRRHRMAQGAEPRFQRDEIRSALGAYNQEVRTGRSRSVRAALTHAVVLYTSLLRIHQFEDGNLRAAFPALQAALVSLGSFPVFFPHDVEEHDDAIGWALRPDGEHRSIEPFVDLLQARTEWGLRRGPRGLP